MSRGSGVETNIWLVLDREIYAVVTERTLESGIGYNVRPLYCFGPRVGRAMRETEKERESESESAHARERFISFFQ